MEYCDNVGKFEINQPVVLPKQSITTLALFNAPQTCAQVYDFGYELLSDLNGDCHVDFKDLVIIAKNWMSSGCDSSAHCQGADFEPDNDVDMDDVAAFVEQWLESNFPQTN